MNEFSSRMGPKFDPKVNPKICAKKDHLFDSLFKISPPPISSDRGITPFWTNPIVFCIFPVNGLPRSVNSASASRHPPTQGDSVEQISFLPTDLLFLLTFFLSFFLSSFLLKLISPRGEVYLPPYPSPGTSWGSFLRAGPPLPFYFFFFFLLCVCVVPSGCSQHYLANTKSPVRVRWWPGQLIRNATNTRAIPQVVL